MRRAGNERRMTAPIVVYVRSDDSAGLHLAAIQLDQAVTGADTFPLMLADEASQPGQATGYSPRCACSRPT